MVLGTWESVLHVVGIEGSGGVIELNFIGLVMLSIVPCEFSSIILLNVRVSIWDAVDCFKIALVPSVASDFPWLIVPPSFAL